MAQTPKWFPVTTPNVVAYELLYSDTGQEGPYALRATIIHQIPGSNYSSEGGYFFYEDDEISYRWYRLRTLDRYGNVAEDTAPTPFKACDDPAEAPTLHFIALNENVGGQNNLQYVSQGGTPVEGATIRVYKKLDYDTRNLTKVVGTTVTNASGNWTSCVFVEPGETYTIVYNKTNEFGPDTTEITV